MEKSKVISGTLSLTISTVIVKVLGLIYKIPLANLLGDEGMGYFNSAYTVYTFFFLLCTAGVPKAVMILVSEAKALQNPKSEQRIVKTALMAFLIISIVTTVLFILLADPLSNLIGNKKSAATMIAIAPSIIFISLAGVIRGYLSAEMKLLEIAVSQIIEGVGKLAFGLVFAMLGVRLKMSLPLVSAFTILGVTLGAMAGLAYLAVSSKTAEQGNNTGQNIIFHSKRKIIKRVFSISLPITASAAIMSITGMIDLTFIMRGLGSIGYTESEASSLYGNYTTLAVPMFNLAVALISPISIAFIPVFTRAYHQKQHELLEESFKSALKLSSFLAAPMMLGLVFFGREILSMLFPKSGVEIGSSLLFLISPAIIFSSVLIITNSFLEACGKVKAPMLSMSVGALAKVIVSYMLLKDPDVGISGAPIGTVVCYAVALICSMIVYTRSFGKALPLFSCCFAQILVAFASVGSVRLLYNLLAEGINNSILLILSISLCALIYIGFSLLFGVINIQKNEKIAKYTNSF